MQSEEQPTSQPMLECEAGQNLRSGPGPGQSEASVEAEGPESQGTGAAFYKTALVPHTW